MALQEGQFQLRDLIIGPGTSYDVGKETNPFIRNIRADQTSPRAWNHGSWSGAEWMEQAAIPFRIVVRGVGTAGWLTAFQQLMAAFAPVGEAAGNLELRFMLGGVEYVMFGRPRMVEPDSANIATGSSRVRAAFVATDPLIYSGTLNSTGAIELPTYVGGMSFPLLLPSLIETTRVGGAASLVNAGTAPGGIRLRIDGPVNEPRVSVQHSDGSVNTLRFHIDIPAGQWLIVDTAARTVFLNGLPQASRRGEVTADPDWPLAQPGSNELRFGASDDDIGTMTAEWRSAWW